MLSRKRNRRILSLGWRTAVVLSVAVLLPLLLVVSVTTSTTTVAQAGGEFVEGVVGSPLHINPLLASFNVAPSYDQRVMTLCRQVRQEAENVLL